MVENFARKKSTRLAAVVASAWLVACACGNPGTSATPSNQPLEAVKLGSAPFNAINVPAILGDRNGAFKAKGVTIESVGIASPANLVPALLSGSVDVTYGSLTNVIPAILKGEPLSFFCGLASSSGAQLLVQSNSKIKSDKDLGTWQSVLQQLGGKKVGVPAIGVEDHQRIVAAVRDAGVNPSGVTFVAVGVGATAVAALKSGQIDVLMTYPFEDVPLISSGQSRSIIILGPPSGPTLFQNTWKYGFVAKRDWVKGHARAAKAFCDGIGAGINAIDDPKYSSVVNSVLTKDGGLADTDLTAAKQDLKQLGFSIALPRTTITASVQLLSDQKIIAQIVPYETLVQQP